jgi:hypothetical protein
MFVWRRNLLLFQLAELETIADDTVQWSLYLGSEVGWFYQINYAKYKFQADIAILRLKSRSDTGIDAIDATTSLKWRKKRESGIQTAFSTALTSRRVPSLFLSKMSRRIFNVAKQMCRISAATKAVVRPPVASAAHGVAYTVRSFGATAHAPNGNADVYPQ